MTIDTFILANNEERLIPYLLRHYSQFSRVIILESNSTDSTVEVARSLGAEVWSYEVPDEINDRWFTDLKNTCWKDSKADWVIVVDADEFIYHPDIKSALSRTRGTIVKPRFYNMYSESFPITKGQIYEEVNRGLEQLTPNAKMNIFRPSQITNINYYPGCHDAIPQGKVLIDDKTQIKTLHMRNLGKDFVIERNLRARNRNSSLNKQMGWGVHVEWSQDRWIEIFNDEIARAKVVIEPISKIHYPQFDER